MGLQARRSGVVDGLGGPSYRSTRSYEPGARCARPQPPVEDQCPAPDRRIREPSHEFQETSRVWTPLVWTLTCPLCRSDVDSASGRPDIMLHACVGMRVAIYSRHDRAYQPEPRFQEPVRPGKNACCNDRPGLHQRAWSRHTPAGVDAGLHFCVWFSRIRTPGRCCRVHLLRARLRRLLYAGNEAYETVSMPVLRPPPFQLALGRVWIVSFAASEILRLLPGRTRCGTAACRRRP